MDSREQLSLTSVLLHWVIAVTMIALCLAGLIMVNAEVWSLYPLHKSVGVAITALVIWRVVRRLRTGLPMAVNAQPVWALSLSKFMHWSLLACTVLMPISGMMYSGASGHGFGLFDLTLVPVNHDPDNPAQVIPYHAGLAEFGQTMHHYLGYLLAALIVLHVIAALKHQLFDKDGVMPRMLGRRID